MDRASGKQYTPRGHLLLILGTFLALCVSCDDTRTGPQVSSPEERYLDHLRDNLHLGFEKHGAPSGSGMVQVRDFQLEIARRERVDLMRCYELARSDADLRPKVAYVLMMAESKKYLRAVSVSPDDPALEHEYTLMASILRRSAVKKGPSPGYMQNMLDVAQLSTLPEAKMAAAAGLVRNGDVERGIGLALAATVETPSDTLWWALDNTAYLAPESERNAVLLAHLDSITMEGVEAAKCLWRLGVQREEMVEYLRKAAETGPSSVSRRAATFRSKWEQ